MADSVVHLILLGKELHGKDIYLVVDSLLLLLFVYALIYLMHKLNHNEWCCFKSNNNIVTNLNDLILARLTLQCSFGCAQI